MKYVKNDFLTKLIIFALLLAISVGLSACSEGTDEESASSDESLEESFVLPDFSEEEQPEDDIEFTREKAIALIGSDRLVTEIFVNNSLYKGINKNAEYYGLPVESEYVNFKAITSLLNNTYTKAGGCAEEFLSYPLGLPPAVTQKNGRTYVFRHPTEQYIDFIRPDTVRLRMEIQKPKSISPPKRTQQKG